ncbi:MAG: hypothetical protein HON51_09655 [Gammaproteobacteria bacterium]|jgi:hypothetical protein|nr:hypothetical protein [Candidatus Neomarinimicrobiota bacterium]MBT6576469.1 hypothetical protein [Gammaproteobacteria bacterium]MBT7443734.1 hypothetical protein [Methylococcales bacterium]
MIIIAEDVNSGEKIEVDVSDENLEALRSLAQEKVSDSKLQSYIDNLDMSADAKVLIGSILKTTVKVGELIVRVGKRLVELVVMIVAKFPNATFGLILGLLVGALVAAIPFLGAILSTFVMPIAAIFGLAKGYIDDCKDQALAHKIAEAVAIFQPLNGEMNVAN